MSETKRCPICKGEHNGEVAAARCALEDAIITELTAYAADLDKPPSVAEVRDLWAHARDMRDDSTAAARWVRQTLDLGWRPVFGHAS